MTRFGTAAIAALGLLLAGTAAQAQMSTTNRMHMSPGTGQSTGLPQPSLPDFREPATRKRVILRRKAPIGRFGSANAKLSRACREGSFRQTIDRRLVAVLDGKVYGAAVGGRNSLVDPLRLGNRGIVYVFVGQGTTSCRVFVGGAGRG